VHKIPPLARAARRRLIHSAKKTKDPHTALRFLMITKLGQGLSRQQVARDLACVPSTVVKATKRVAESRDSRGWFRCDPVAGRELRRSHFGRPRAA
jgi:hypothetical protein